MSKYVNKVVAPIIIVIVIGVFIGVLLSSLDLSTGLKAICFLVPLLVIGVFVLIERIKEIRSGEEDDLGQY